MLPMRIELIISSFHDLLQDWCLTTMALEALFGSAFSKGRDADIGNRTRVV
jgi:hypothetical protein